MFLDDTACNLASLNLLAFRARGRPFRHRGSIEHAVRLWTVVLEISVLMAQFPSREIARLSYDYRTLGLGYANLGGLLMADGIPYDSDEGRAICAAVTAVMTGMAYATSAEMAGELGPFSGYEANRASMLRVIRNHRRAARRARPRAMRASRSPPVPLRCVSIARTRRWSGAVADAWDEALALGEAHGYRNAQVDASSRPPAPSASSWIATRPASSRTSRW